MRYTFFNFENYLLYYIEKQVICQKQPYLLLYVLVSKILKGKSDLTKSIDNWILIFKLINQF